MATFTNATKQSAATFTNVNRSSGTIYPYTKGGEGMQYDSPAVYDEDIDPVSGNPVFYDTGGTAPTYTNQTKS